MKKMITDYLLTNDMSTCDPYDVWKTTVGVKLKLAYYKNKYMYLAPAGLLAIYDLYLNNRYRFGYEKQEYPIVRAQAVLVLLKQYKNSPCEKYMRAIKAHLNWLVENASSGYSGYCWGINFVWASKNGIYPKDMPHVTHTPYVLEAMINYEKLTGDKSFSHVVMSVFDFLENDIKVMVETDDMLAMSYAPVDEPRVVINANSYIMYMYTLLLDYYPDKEGYIIGKIKRIYNFIVSHQKGDGSWLYYADDLSGNFIDCFHTAFILKNLHKTNLVVELEKCNESIKKGFEYIVCNFYDNNKGLFKRFTLNDKPNLVAYDLYDNAEMLNILKIINDEKFTKKLCASISINFVSGGDIYSKISKGGRLIDKNMLRWAVMPYLLALSEMK